METIIRPLPVPGDVAVRSALLALAKLGAELQSYNEEGRTIVARLPKRFGMTKASILVTVQDFGENSRLELKLADKSKANEILDQISLYLVDGHRAAGDMTMRWVEKQDQSLAQSAGKTVGRALRRLTANSSADGAATTESVPTAEEDQPTTEAPTTETLSENDVQVLDSDEANEASNTSESIDSQPDNKLIVPEFIKANQGQEELSIMVTPDFFVDRSSHLEKCPNCENVLLRGSQFCGQCGRPITMEAVSKEVNEGGRNTARSSFTFAILALICNIVAGYFLFAPIIASLVTNSDVQPFSPISIFLAVLLGLAPSVYLALEARRMAKTTEIYVKFRFNKAEEGRKLAKWGAQISWVSIGISGLLLLILILRAATATA